jgi:hypothetical protein
MAPTEQNSLHRAINKLVEQRAQKALDNDDPINLPDWLDQMVQSMADLILYAAPPEEHGRMLSYAVSRLQEIVSAETEAGKMKNLKDHE